MPVVRKLPAKPDILFGQFRRGGRRPGVRSVRWGRRGQAQAEQNRQPTNQVPVAYAHVACLSAQFTGHLLDCRNSL